MSYLLCNLLFTLVLGNVLSCAFLFFIFILSPWDSETPPVSVKSPKKAVASRSEFNIIRPSVTFRDLIRSGSQTSE